uniref:hypothetical protein n=1 Tax=Pedobacter schmidteae TaxID=2201271 RepID=UPI000EACE473|nr:hypothetical protein [Pedobacter schmidteae]
MKKTNEKFYLSSFKLYPGFSTAEVNSCHVSMEIVSDLRRQQDEQKKLYTKIRIRLENQAGEKMLKSKFLGSFLFEPEEIEADRGTLLNCYEAYFVAIYSFFEHFVSGDVNAAIKKQIDPNIFVNSVNGVKVMFEGYDIYPRNWGPAGKAEIPLDV